MPHTRAHGVPCPECDDPNGCREVFDKKDTVIFVFGSNEAGIHGRGSALHARRYYGALQGLGKGPMGMAYAIPTKDRTIKTLPLAKIKDYVDEFLRYAERNPSLKFQVVPIGCGLAGYDPDDIAPMFEHSGANVFLPMEFTAALNRRRSMSLFETHE